MKSLRCGLTMRHVAVILIGLSVLLSNSLYAFQFKDTTGQVHQLSDYKGRWVLVNFWATWCPPCLKEIPDLIVLSEKRKDIMIIGVAMDTADDASVVLDFMRSMAINYPIVLGDRMIASQLDDVSLLPSTYFYDPDGNPAARQQGIVTRENIEAFIDARSTIKPASR